MNARLPRWTAWTLIALPLVIVTSGCLSPWYEAETSMAGKLPTSPGSARTVAADFSHGSMTVSGSDAPKIEFQADVTVLAMTQERADTIAGALELRFDETEDRVDIVIEPPRHIADPKEYRIHVSSVIRVPRQSNLDVKTTHGKLAIARIEGAVRGRTTHGPVRIEDLHGEAKISTSHGKVVARRVEGDTTISTTHGSLELDDLKGNRHSFRTTHGNANLKGIRGVFELITTHGNVDADLGHVGSGDSSIRTSHGRVNCKLSENSSVRVSAATSHAQIRCSVGGTSLDGDNKRATITFGSGEGSLDIKTSHGKIKLTESQSTYQ